MFQSLLEGPRTSWIVFLGAATLIVAAYSAWLYMPIYPDEIAFRIHRARAIQDNFVAPGFYALCQSAAVNIPLVFRVPAYLLSRLDLAFSPTQWRVLPIVLVLSALFMTMRLGMRGRTPEAIAIAASAFLGVAGAGLILARYEIAQEFNVACCLIALSFADRASLSRTATGGLLALLALSALFSVYAHMQGLLLLPLTVYAAHRILARFVAPVPSLVVLIALAGLFAVEGAMFQRIRCDEYPAMDAFYRGMTFQMSDVTSVGPMRWLSTKFSGYFDAFIYRSAYPIGYLPGVQPTEFAPRLARDGLNVALKVVVVANLLLTFALVAATFLSLVRARMRGALGGFASTVTVAPMLLALPVIVLFFYDAAYAFYREAFLNLLVAMALALALSRLDLKRARAAVLVYVALNVGLVAASLVANAVWISAPLMAEPGYTGPSISIRNDWVATRRETLALARTCGADAADGRILVDDMTYDALKKRRAIDPITYLYLQSSVTRVDLPTLLQRLRPNAAITRCESLVGASFANPLRRGDLCCVRFPRAGAE